jgi:hypothetical protein
VSQSVVCSGCGARLDVSEDYARKKMRCDQCGVIFDLPEPANRSSIPANPPSRSAPSPPPARRTPNQKTNPVPAVAPPTQASETPSASTTSIPAPASTPSSGPDESALDESGDDFAFTDGKDSRLYESAKSKIRECPHCHATVHPEAVACSACGFLLVAKKPSRESVAYRWESGWPLRRRVTIFLICQAGVLTLFGTGIAGGISPFAFLLPYLVFTGMTAFLFGTYNWVDLSRNSRGKLRLTQTWRICFVLRPTTGLRIRDYEELAAGVEDSGTISWILVLFGILCGVFVGLVVGFFLGLMMLFLALGGLLSGLFCWLLQSHKSTYCLSLCRDHGYPVVTLYRGWNREQMHDMAETIGSVAGLPLRR